MSKKKNLSDVSRTIPDRPENIKIGIVYSAWNDKITSALLQGAKHELEQSGILPENIHIRRVPGSYELPLGARLLLGKENFEALICLGCIIKGETMHDEFIGNAVSHGIMNLGLTSQVPIIFGVVTTNTEEQAKERSGGSHGNKGVEAAATAIQMITLKNSLKSQEKKIGFS